MLDNSIINKKPKGIMVGVGKQAIDLYPSISENIEILAGLDTAPGKTDDSLFPIFKDIRDVPSASEIEFAVVAVPHYVHSDVTNSMVSHGITVLKEKPFASSLREAYALQDHVMKQAVPVITLVQRAHDPIFRLLNDALKWIGDPYWYAYEYHAAMPGITRGWRAERETAKGGVLLDMGYHSLDRLIQAFGSVVNAAGFTTYCYPQMAEQGLEDACSATLKHQSGVQGTFSVSRHNYEKAEHLKVLGTEGALVVSKTTLSVYSRDGEELQHFTSTVPKRKINAQMFKDAIRTSRDWSLYTEHQAHHMRIVDAIDFIYDSCSSERSLNDNNTKEEKTLCLMAPCRSTPTAPQP